MSERSHSHIPAAHSCSRPTRVKRGRSLSNSSAISNCEPHDFIRLRASAAVGPESREADGCPSFLEKRDRREQSFFIEKNSQCTQISPQGHRVCAPCPNKRCKNCVCVIGCQITRTRIHTLLKCLASAHHDNTRKTVFLPECTIQTDQSVKTKKRVICPPGVPYIVVAPVVTSWAVTGQQVLFLYMYASGTGHADDVPHINP